VASFLKLVNDTDYLLLVDDTSKLILEDIVLALVKWFARNKSIQMIILEEEEWL